MQSRLESRVEKDTTDWAVFKGALSFKMNLHGNTGWPDRWFLFLGQMVAIEFKRKGEDLKRNQPARVEALVSAGFSVGVFDEFNDAANFLEATIFSKRWRDKNDRAGMCRLVLQARPGKDVRNLHGFSYLAGERVYP